MSDKVQIGPFSNVRPDKETQKSSSSEQKKAITKSSSSAAFDAAFTSKKGTYKVDGRDANSVFKLDVEQCETQFRLQPEAATTHRFNGTANIKLPMSPRSKPISPQRRQQQLKQEHQHSIVHSTSRV